MWKVEARVRTSVEDLGLVLNPNEAVYISDDQKRGSLCLSRLVLLGHVRVSFKERSRLSKDPPKSKAATARMSRPGTAKARGGVPVRQGTTPPAPAAGISEAKAQELATKAAEEAAKKAVSALIPALQNILAQQNSGEEDSLDDRIEQAVRRALETASFAPAPAAPSSQSAPVVSSTPDEPLFIPKGIVKEGTEADLQIQSEQSNADLEEAAEALKNLRRKK